jgi:carboxymethylenebutenolidase
MQKETISLRVSPNSLMNAYLVRPDGNGPFAAVIVFQEAFGVNHHIRNVTERIAAAGYVAIAPELFHRSAPPGFEGSYTDFGSVMPHFQALTLEGLSADIEAVYNFLLTREDVLKNKIGSIGFCLGGRVSVLANALLPLAASVSYYGGNMPSILDKIKDLHAPQLLFWGGLDKHILPEHIDSVVKALKEAGKSYINVVISYADHAFNCDERVNYHPQAAREAWAMTIAFLNNHLQN